MHLWLSLCRAPAYSRATLDSGNVAAQIIRNLFLAAVQRKSGARILIDGGKIASYRRLYLAATPYLQRCADVLASVYVGLQRAGECVKKNLARSPNVPLIGFNAAAVGVANLHRAYRVQRAACSVQRADANALAEQQRIGDAFT